MTQRKDGLPPKWLVLDSIEQIAKDCGWVDRQHMRMEVELLRELLERQPG